MYYLDEEDILLIHSFIIDSIGGSHGLRHGALQSVVGRVRQQVFGKELYPDIFSKAASYAMGIIMSHTFVDGNKRTSMTVAAVFLERNGYQLRYQRGLVEQFALRIVNNRLVEEQIAEWFKKHCQKLPAS